MDAVAPLVKAFQALRGVRLITAVILAAEIGDYARFGTPRELMALSGLGAQRRLQRVNDDAKAESRGQATVMCGGF